GVGADDLDLRDASGAGVNRARGGEGALDCLVSSCPTGALALWSEPADPVSVRLVDPERVGRALYAAAEVTNLGVSAGDRKAGATGSGGRRSGSRSIQRILDLRDTLAAVGGDRCNDHRFGERTRLVVGCPGAGG